MLVAWGDAASDSKPLLRICGRHTDQSYGYVVEFPNFRSGRVCTLTHLKVMFLPIRLIWNLQMEKAKKIGCGLLFASGFVCILFSTIRIVQVGQDGKPKSPDPKWLTLWTIVECSTGESCFLPCLNSY